MKGDDAILIDTNLLLNDVQFAKAMLEKKEDLSILAYKQGDKASYKALNKAATDAWGKNFFTMVAYSAGILAPIPFALGWMHTRFDEVKFLLAYPLSLIFGDTVGYTFTFILIYILSRIIFKYIRRYVFKKI